MQTRRNVLICTKACFLLFFSAVLVNLVNVLFLYSYMCVSQYGHAEGVTFNSDLCQCRSVAGSRNRSTLSLIRRDRNSGQRVHLPISLAFCPLPLSSCRPLLPLSSQLILSIPRLLDQSGITVGTRARAGRSRRRRRAMSCLLVTSC